MMSSGRRCVRARVKKLTNEEFYTAYLGTKPVPKNHAARGRYHHNSMKELHKTINWREKGVVSSTAI